MARIIQLADIHFGTEDPAALKAFEAAFEAIDPHAMAVCGDLTQRGKRSEFKAAREWLDEFDVPKLVVAGNHDTPMLNLYERVVSPFERHDRYFQTHASPITVGTATLSGLNTSRGWQTRRNWAEGAVNLDDLEQAITDIDHVSTETGLLVCHHPFISPPDAPMRTSTRRGRRASRRLAHSPVNFLLTGHVHTPSVTQVGNSNAGYVAVSAGTLSTRLRTSPASFNLIDLTEETCSITVFQLQGEHFEPKQPHLVRAGEVRGETSIPLS